MPPGETGVTGVRSHASTALAGASSRMAVPASMAAHCLEPGPPRSDGTIERARAQVVHFPLQAGFLTSVPSIYHPHDLSTCTPPAVLHAARAPTPRHRRTDGSVTRRELSQ